MVSMSTLVHSPAVDAASGDESAMVTPRPDTDEVSRLRARYLDLMKRALTHLLYRPMDVHFNDADYVPSDEMREAAAKEFAKPDFDWANVRAEGRDWPRYAQTMVGMKRLDNVQHCVERVIEDGVPGDLIETGVWRGGVMIFMRAILDAFDDRDRAVFAADSFQGLPPPDEQAYPADAGSQLHTAKSLAVPRAEVERNFELYGLLDDRVRFLEGWFKDTLPTVRDRTWAVIRLDGDMYESTMDGLVNLYPQLAVGGFLIIDDYAHVACRQAVTDYRDAHGMVEAIEPIDELSAFWRRVRYS
jgi:hypothetical protein